MTTFDDTEEKEFLKTSWGKEKMLVTSIFSFPHHVFYPVKDKCLSNVWFVVCKYFQFGQD